MMTLKYSVPCVCGNENPDSTVFTLPPQGGPEIFVVTQANLQRLSVHIRQRLNSPMSITCHPHRVGLSSCVAVTVEVGSAEWLIFLSLLVGRKAGL